MSVNPVQELKIVRQAGKLLTELVVMKRQMIGRHDVDLEIRMPRLEQLLINIITGNRYQKDLSDSFIRITLDQTLNA